MKKYVFKSHLLSDGHLYCPDKYKNMKQAKFHVVVSFDDLSREASDAEIEAAAMADISEDFLSEDELNYYLNLSDNE